MPLKKDLGQWISHFEKSDAPQFKDKSKEERKDMALAAFRAKYGSLDEAIDINDPALARFRAQMAAREKKAAEPATSPISKADKNADKIKALKIRRAELMRDMEQEAEPEGGPIADRYGAMLNKIDTAIAKLSGTGEWGPETNPYMDKDEIERRAASLEEEEEGVTAAEEDKFHRELDKLVHKTFGHSSDEKKEAVEKAMKKIKEVVKIPTSNPQKPDAPDIQKAKKLSLKDTDFEFVKKGMVAETLTEGQHYDYEGKMAHSQLLSIVKNARDLFNMINSDTQLKSWVQSKLTKAEDYLDSVRTYLEGESLTSTAPAMFENESIKDETGVSLSIGDVVKGGDGRIYQVVYSYSEGKPMMVPFDLKRRKPLSLRDKIYFDSDSSIPKKLNKVMDYTATKGGFMK